MMKNYKLIICLFLLLGSALAKAQATYDFQVAAVSPEPFSVAVGEEGQIFIDVGYLGDAPVPIGGIRVQLSISGEIEIPLPVNFSDNGCYLSGGVISPRIIDQKAVIHSMESNDITDYKGMKWF